MLNFTAFLQDYETIRIQYHIFEYMPSTELYYFQWLWG